ncbi:MAG: hypothetical protein V1824_01675 [archaeon]
MDKNLLLFEFVFIVSIIANLFLENNLSLKILLIVLMLFLILKSKDDYIFNKSKFLYISFGLVSFSILFIFLGYFRNIYLVAVAVSLISVFWYIDKVRYNISYGKIISASKKEIEIKILDSFYKPNQLIRISASKQYEKNAIAIFNTPSLFCKDYKLIKVVLEEKEKASKIKISKQKPSKAKAFSRNLKNSKKEKR